MAFFTDTKTYTITVKDSDGVEAEVELRRLNAGDRAAIEDTLQMSSDSQDVSVKLGTLKFLTVEKAVVTWSLEVAATPETIRQLEPAVFDQIFDSVSFGNPSGTDSKKEDES